MNIFLKYCPTETARLLKWAAGGMNLNTAADSTRQFMRRVERIIGSEDPNVFLKIDWAISCVAQHEECVTQSALYYILTDDCPFTGACEYLSL